MRTFNTLLLREWLQYRWGWAGIVLIPVIVLLALVPFSQVAGVETMAPEPIALISAGLTMGLVMAITLATSFYQLMALPRRDQQDRSIEFWKSLPGTDSQSLAAPLLAHALLLPLSALVLATAGGALVGAAMAFKELGPDGLRQMQWAGVGVAGVWLLARLMLGLVLALLWLSPFLLALMAASAWLKRWGAPLLMFGLGGLIKLYDGRALMEVLGRQVLGAKLSLISGAPGLTSFPAGNTSLPMEELYDALYRFPSWAPQDMLLALQHMLSPQFFGGLVVAAACFGLMVWQRRRVA
jgi:ABC-2 type transport system permease protein